MDVQGRISIFRFRFPDEHNVDHYKTELSAHAVKVSFNYFVGPSLEPLK
jgi:hypothetical protein